MNRLKRVFFIKGIQLGNGEVFDNILIGKDVPPKYRGIIVDTSKHGRVIIKHKDWDFEVDLPESFCYFHKETDGRLRTIEKARKSRKNTTPPKK